MVSQMAIKTGQQVATELRREGLDDSADSALVPAAVGMHAGPDARLLGEAMGPCVEPIM